VQRQEDQHGQQDDRNAESDDEATTTRGHA
jgi:hypothetical protein